MAALPIVAMLVTLGVLRWKATHLAGGFSWVIALLVAVTAFGMPITMALSTSAHGFLYGLFPIVWILLTAIWMYDITVVSGRFDDLRRAFFLLSDDPRVLALLIAFCFGGLLESLAGFGAPVAITSAMLVAIGVQPDPRRHDRAAGQHRAGRLRRRRAARSPWPPRSASST